MYGHTVVDMARMQYGSAARGSLGENYYLGTWRDYEDSMEDVCAGVLIVGVCKILYPRTLNVGADNVERLATGAKRVGSDGKREKLKMVRLLRQA